MYSIEQLETMTRNNSIREHLTQAEELRTGIPRKEYENDHSYKQELKEKRNAYKSVVMDVFIPPTQVNK